MHNLYIMVGPSGSGKSTWVKNHSKMDASCVASADQYFTGSDGIYRFDGSSLPEAHKQCYSKCKDALWHGVQSIFVDNTNLEHRHRQQYAKLAEEHGYNVIYVVFDFSDNEKEKTVKYLARNVHDVPEFALRRQLGNFEPLTVEERDSEVIEVS